jgi:hypothetical protein
MKRHPTLTKNIYRENIVETHRKFTSRKLNQETSFTGNEPETFKHPFFKKMQPKRREHLFNYSIKAHHVASHIYSLKIKCNRNILNISFAKKENEHSSFENSVKVKLCLYRPWRPLGLREVQAPTFSDIRLTDGGKVVSPTLRPLFYHQEDSWYSLLLEAESTPGP